MKIDASRWWREEVRLRKPYKITGRLIDRVSLFFVEIHSGRPDSGLTGYGCASPAEEVTGESTTHCERSLASEWLVGRDPRHLGELTRELHRRTAGAPAAAAAIDMALHDLFTKILGVPLVDYLGRYHSRLPTSITVGIQDTHTALEEIEEYLAAGFRSIKVKIGEDFDADVDRLTEIRKRCGEHITVRVDANRGYDLEQTRRLCRLGDSLNLELIEQPLARADFFDLRELERSERAKMAADESLIGIDDAWSLVQPPSPCGIFNIKLMKCGGVSPGHRIGTLVEQSGDGRLMWGCMDESRVSIAAALHTAFSCANTSYLDLDGSFDLATDPFDGGFRLVDGVLETLPAPGLGVVPKAKT